MLTHTYSYRHGYSHTYSYRYGNSYTYCNTKIYSNPETSTKSAASPDTTTTLARLTENSACLGFVPVRVVEQRNPRGKMSFGKLGLFRFRYRLSAFSN
jgi:hypothetical protein